MKVLESCETQLDTLFTLLPFFRRLSKKPLHEGKYLEKG